MVSDTHGSAAGLVAEPLGRRARASTAECVRAPFPPPISLHLLLAALLTLLAAVIRMTALNPSTLFVDDSWQSLVDHAHSPSEFLLYALTSPGFTLALDGVQALPGRLELLAQLVAFVAGCLLAGGVYLAACKLGATTLGALLAGALLTFSNAAAVYSDRVKPYTFDALTCLLVLLAAGLVLQTPSRRHWLGLLVLSTLAPLASGQALIISGTSVAVCLLAPGSRAVLRGRVRLVLIGPLLAAALAWFGYLARSTGNQPLQNFWRSQGAYIDVSWGGVGSTLTGFFTNLLPAGTSSWQWYTSSGSRVTVVALATFLTLLLIVRAARRSGWLVLLLLAPLVVSILGSVAGKIPFGVRVDIPLYPGFAMVLALGVPPVPRLVALRRSVVGGLAVVALLLTAATADAVSTSYSLHDYAPLVLALKQAREPGTPVFSDGNSTYPLYRYGISSFRVVPDPKNFTGFKILPDDKTVLTGGQPTRTDQSRRLTKLRQSLTPIWLVEYVRAVPGHPSQADPRPHPTRYSLALAKDAHYDLCRRQEWSGARLTLWKPRGTCDAGVVP